jgi:hypothetical protein
MRSMVEGIGARRTGGDNHLNYGIRVSRYFSGRDAQQVDAFAGKPLVAHGIQFRSHAHFVSDAIDFDRQSCFAAEEVEHVVAGRMLAPKFEATRAKAES